MDDSKTEPSKSIPGICRTIEDLIELNSNLGLWLKPMSKINVTVALPQMKVAGQCISTWNVTEKIKKRVKPHQFKNLKVIKSTLEFIRFEGELETKSAMETVIGKLDRSTLKLSGFQEQLKVKACKVKLGPTRHEWETFFRDNPNMDEMKPGLRPDTIHLKNLPIKWFGGDEPKPNLLLETFQTFGDIRRFHIPYLDQLESQQSVESNSSTVVGGFKRFNFTETLNFDAFIMYRDYIGFVKAMDSLRGKKLVKQLDEVDKYLEYEIQVDFDKTKHLSDRSIKNRRLVRDYGLKDIKELKNLQVQSKKDRTRYEERVKLLKDRQKKAEKLLTLLFHEVEKEIEAREKKREEEEKLRNRLLLEEGKLRERLLEKRRQEIRKKLSQSGQSLKSIASSCPKNNIHHHSHSHDHNQSPYSSHSHRSHSRDKYEASADGYHPKPRSLVVPVCRKDENK